MSAKISDDLERAILELAMRGRGELDGRAIARDLSEQVGLDEPSARTLVGQMTERRLLRRTMGPTERIGVTAAGRARLQELVAPGRETVPAAGPIVPSAETILELELGAAHAPDSTGLDVLVVSRTGEIQYAHQVQDRVIRRRGRVDVEAVRATVDALVRAGFPRVPAHDRAPGGDHARLAISTEHGRVEAHFVPALVEGAVGYGESLGRLRAWVSALRSGVQATSDGGDVHDIVEEPPDDRDV